MLQVTPLNRRSGTLVLVVVAAVLSGCVPAFDATPVGAFHGSIDLQWINPDRFMYTPDPDDPFRFERASGEIVQPKAMVTDGGSVPRAFRVSAALSPWRYAPAYVLHDWMFRSRQCGLLPAGTYSFRDSVEVTAEALKTHMEQNPAVHHVGVYEVIMAAIASPVAWIAWHVGNCLVPDYDPVHPSY